MGYYPFTATTFASLSPLTTEGDIIIENATPAPARLAIGPVNDVLTSTGSLPGWAPALALLATTGAAGFALQNGTPTIMTWTAPNDGALHRVIVIGELLVSSNETGGQVSMNFTDPGGTGGRAVTLVAAAQSTGLAAVAFSARTVEANTAVTVTQTALTVGAAILYAELWGS